LGPVDLADWDYGEDDALRAEIRILPVVALYASQPAALGGVLGENVGARLRAFQKGVVFATEELRQLCADLKTANRKIFP